MLKKSMHVDTCSCDGDVLATFVSKKPFVHFLIEVGSMISHISLKIKIFSSHICVVISRHT